MPPPAATKMAASAAPIVLALPVFLLWIALGLPGDQRLVGDAFLTYVGAVAAVAAWQASRRCAPVPALKTVWQLFALAVLCGFVGGVSGLVRDVADPESTGTIADGVALAFYPLMLFALLRVPKPASSRDRRLRLSLDIAVTVLGLSTVLWYAVVGPAIWASDETDVDLALSFVFLAGDLALIVGIAVVVARGCPPVLRRPLELIQVALLLIIVADVLLARESLHQFGGHTVLVATLYVAAISMGGLGALAQRAVVAGDPAARPAAAVERSARADWLPSVAVLIAFGVLLITQLDQDFFPDVSLAVAAIVIAVLVGIRQHIAQRELTRSQGRFRRAIDGMAEGMVQSSEAGFVLWANVAAESYFGAERGGLLGRDVRGLLVDASWDDYFERRTTVIGRRLDGRTFPLEIAVSEMDVEGERILVTVGQDVSDRRRREGALQRSEQRFRAVFDSAGVGMVLAEAISGEIVDLNAAAATMLGGTLDELRGMTYATFLPADSTAYREDPEIVAVITGAMPEAPVQREVRIGRLDGTSLWVHVTLSTAEDERGGPGYIICVLEDITERRAVERVKDEFVSVVGHELRTPLTSIRGSLGLVQSGMLAEEETAEMLTVAVTNADRLARLIEDILDVERLDAGQSDLALAPVSARELVASSLQVVQRMAEDAGITLQIDAEDVRVLADGDRIVQTLVNLLTNAVKFSDRGSGVTVRVERADGVAVFSVADSGRGIPADQLETIFERFRQVDGSDAREKGGSGLGLAIARGIVLQHGGRIWAESDEGHGAMLRFTLPLAPG